MWSSKVLLHCARRISSVAHEPHPVRFLGLWNKLPHTPTCIKKRQHKAWKVKFLTTESAGSGAEGRGWSSEDDTKSEPEGKTEEAIKNEILDNALHYVCDHGWTRESLSLGAQEAGYAVVAEGMFDKGGVDLLMHLVDSSNADLNKYMSDLRGNEDGEKMKVSEFVKDVLEQRLRMIIPYIGVWPDAMAILLQPQNVVDATKSLGRMVDDIWFRAGDTATDYTWYTKRAVLAKLYLSTQTVMINDDSCDFEDSWKFLGRRMDDLASFGRMSQNVQKAGQTAYDVTFAATTVLRNIMGIGDTRR